MAQDKSIKKEIRDLKIAINELNKREYSLDKHLLNKLSDRLDELIRESGKE